MPGTRYARQSQLEGRLEGSTRTEQVFVSVDRLLRPPEEVTFSASYSSSTVEFRSGRLPMIGLRNFSINSLCV